MLLQMLFWLVGTVWAWILSYEPPLEAWYIVSRGNAGVATLFGWMPAIPYIPYQALNMAVVSLMSAFLVLLGGAIAIRIGRMFHFLGDGPR